MYLRCVPFLLVAVVANAHEALEQRTDAQSDLCFEAIDQGKKLHEGGDYRAAIAIYTQAIDQQASARLYLHRSRAWFKLDEAGKACADLGRGLSLVAEDDQQLLASLYLQLATVEAFRQNYSQAIDAANLACDVQPNCVSSIVHRASIYRQFGDYPRAIADLSRAIELAPYDNEYRHTRAHYLFEVSEYDEAIADFDEIAKQGAEAPKRLACRALCELFAGDSAAAAANLDRAVALEPGDLRYRALLARALVFAAGDRTPERLARANAIMEAIRAETDAGDIRFLQLHARILGGAGDWQAAIHLQRQALAATPDDAKPEIGLILWKLEQRRCLLAERDDLDFDIW